MTKIDISELAKITAPDRAFVSLYLSGPDSMNAMKKQIRTTELMLGEYPDELQYFKENMKLVNEYLLEHPPANPGVGIFACWILGFFKTVELAAVVEDQFRVDSSPYIRPLAFLQDEYENFAVVAADNKKTRVFLVSSMKAQSETSVRGNIKNHVRKGGWSQQRYERRRDNQLRSYADEVVASLADLEKSHVFDRIILVGSKETLEEIQNALPERLATKLAGTKAIHLAKDANWVDKEIFDLFLAQERKSEKQLWEKIKGEYMRNGLAVAGVSDVLEMARAGRVDRVIVNHDAQLSGVRCRQCERLDVSGAVRCRQCDSDSLFAVDLVNEIVELVALTSGKTEFAESIEGLKKVGDIAALLRY